MNLDDKQKVFQEAYTMVRSLKSVGMDGAAKVMTDLIEVAQDQTGLNLFASWRHVEEAREHTVAYLRGIGEGDS